MTSDVEDTRWKMKNYITLITKVILGDSRATFMVNKDNHGGTRRSMQWSRKRKNYAILRKKKCRIEENFAKHKEIKAKQK